MKTNKTFGAVKRLASLLVAVVVLMTAFSSNAFAANQAVQDDCNGVLLIEWGYANNGVFTPYSVGSGFLINDNTIITCYHVVHATTAEQERDLAGKFGDGWKKKMEIHIVYQAGNYYTATEIAEIANSYADYTALTIGSKTISGHTKLTLSTAEAAKTDSVSALGFPYETTLIEDTTSGTFTVKDVNVMTGTVNKAAVSIDGIDYINHSASLVGGYSGGPLVDENGYVIGINAGKIDNSFNYAITISQLIESLRTTSTEYSSTEGGSSDSSSDKPADKSQLEAKIAEASAVENPSAELTAAINNAQAVDANVNATDSDISGALDELSKAMSPAPTVDTTRLKNLIAQADALNTDDYDDDYLAEVSKAKDNAQAVVDNANATEQEVQAAESELQSLLDNPVTVSILPLLIICAGVLLIIVVLIILIVSSRKKKAAASGFDAPDSMPVSSVPPTGNQTGGFTAASQVPATDFRPVTSDSEGISETGVLNSGAAETGILSAGASETTVLSTKPFAKLTRKTTGTSVQVNAEEFIIGKERRKVNYCIDNNTSISRTHAKIVKSGDSVSLVDLNSKNGTYVNGVKCTPNVTVALGGGDKIVLADEEFTFERL